MEVLLCDVVLRQALAIVASPDRDMEILLVIVDEFLQPNGREALSVSLPAGMKLKEYR
jgi:hypothetical protein